MAGLLGSFSVVLGQEEGAQNPQGPERLGFARMKEVVRLRAAVDVGQPSQNWQKRGGARVVEESLSVTIGQARFILDRQKLGFQKEGLRELHLCDQNGIDDAGWHPEHYYIHGGGCGGARHNVQGEQPRRFGVTTNFWAAPSDGFSRVQKDERWGGARVAVERRTERSGGHKEMV